MASVTALVVTGACAQSDPGITTAVKTKLAADDTVKAYQINVDTTNHVVTLSGAVDTPAAKDQAVLIARQTDGVGDVVDHLTVGREAATPADDTRQQAEEAAQKIRDRAREGSDAVKEAGREAAATTGKAADRAGTAITDAAITVGVKGKFLVDTAVSGLKIDVDTKEGVVTLNGSVATPAEADRAVSLARGTDGVKRVVSNLRVGR